MSKSDKRPRRPRGTGSLFRRGGVWWMKFYVAGKARRESTGCTKESKAAAKLKKRIAEVSVGKFIPDAERVTIGDLFMMLAADYQAKRNRSRPRLKRLCEWFDVATSKDKDGTVTYSGGWRAMSVTTDRVRSYEAARLADGAGRATVNSELAALRRGFRLAVEAERLPSRPVIKTPTPRNARKGFFSASDIRLVLDELPEDVAPVVRFGFLTGWRIASEVLPLTWSAVDWNAGEVRLAPGTTKNDEGRSFAFDEVPELRAVLERQLENTRRVERREGRIVRWVFHRDGNPIRSIRKAWTSALRRAATEERNGREVVVRPEFIGRWLHDLRRSAVRNLEAAGVSRSVAMNITGHKTEAVYRRYAIVDETAQREGLRKLAATVSIEKGHRTGTIGGGHSPKP